LKDVKGFQEFFATKALPTSAILQIMKKMGFGLDCASPSELILARKNGFRVKISCFPPITPPKIFLN